MYNGHKTTAEQVGTVNYVQGVWDDNYHVTVPITTVVTLYVWIVVVLTSERRVWWATACVQKRSVDVEGITMSSMCRGGVEKVWWWTVCKEVKYINKWDLIFYYMKAYNRISILIPRIMHYIIKSCTLIKNRHINKTCIEKSMLLLKIYLSN